MYTNIKQLGLQYWYHHPYQFLFIHFFYNHISDPYSTCLNFFTIFAPPSFRLFMSMHMDKAQCVLGVSYTINRFS